MLLERLGSVLNELFVDGKQVLFWRGVAQQLANFSLAEHSPCF